MVLMDLTASFARRGERPFPPAPAEAHARLDGTHAVETTLRCVTCRRPFDFAAGQTALILRHIAYGYDFAHSGACEAAALDRIFVEPGYDRPAFAYGNPRARVLRSVPATGWEAVMPRPAGTAPNGGPFRFEPLRWWALVEYRDGTKGVEGIVLDEEWQDEPGGAEFPMGHGGRQDAVGYVRPAERNDPARRRQWQGILARRSREYAGLGGAAMPRRAAA
jgi:hypothetical protein